MTKTNKIGTNFLYTIRPTIITSTNALTGVYKQINNLLCFTTMDVD